MAVKGTRERSSSGAVMGLVLFVILLFVYMWYANIANPFTAVRGLYNAALGYLPSPIADLIRGVVEFVMGIIRRILQEFERLLRQLM